jgi:hypothetical protein
MVLAGYAAFVAALGAEWLRDYVDSLRKPRA